MSAKVDRWDWWLLVLMALTAYLGTLETAHGAYWAKCQWPELAGQVVTYSSLGGIALGLLAIVFPRRERAKEWWVDPETGAKKRVVSRMAGQRYTETGDTWTKRAGSWAHSHRTNQALSALFFLLWLAAPFLMNLDPSHGAKPALQDHVAIVISLLQLAAWAGGSIIDIMLIAVGWAIPLGLMAWASSLRRRNDLGPDEYRPRASPFPAAPQSSAGHDEGLH